MRHHAMTTGAAVVCALLAGAAVGCSDDEGSDSLPSEPPAPQTVSASPDQLGDILVDGKGRTLYLFEADTASRSACVGQCIDVWPPLLVTDGPEAGHGIRRRLLGRVHRGDGDTQVTYGGHPLYLYVGDEQPGDTNGQALEQFGAKWFVLGGSGRRITGLGGPGADRS
jgi:predicted lipoprotein with Yx(FWY)xxD motif